MRFGDTTFARQVNTTDLSTYLTVIAKHNCYVALEWDKREGVRGDVISLVDRDGKPFPATVAGFTYCPLSMPHRVFEGLTEAGLIEEHRPQDAQGRTFFRLTPKGVARAADLAACRT